MIDERNTAINHELERITKEEIETLCYNERRVNDHINFEKVELSGDVAAGEKLMVLEGYVPVEDEPQTTESLQQESLYFQVSTPTPDDNPPIKLKNSRFARVFEMIANLYDRPNYNAFDLTAFFAPFYIIFFGLCLGDCGYGFIILAASLFLRRSKDGFLRSSGQLATYLGIGTMLFGFVSGGFFGISLPELQVSWLEPLKGAMLGKNQLFFFALIIGSIQIIYGQLIKGITQWMRYGFFYSLDSFGFILTLLGNGAVYLLTDKGIIAAEMQYTVHIVISSIGGFMMLFFNSPDKGIRGVPGSIGAGLFGLYTKASGLMGDLLSYIRLFALGISGAVMGLVFNQLAVGFAPDIIIVKQLVMILILLFGHGINIFISGLGAFIHPMRLTFVEFYNNAGFEGGGKEYVPFKTND
jgi:V/A-type H+-transporting ATPase subunit I